MKKQKIYPVIFIFFALVFVIRIPVLAESTTKYNMFDESASVDKNGLHIKDIIGNTFSYEAVERFFQTCDKRYTTEDFYIDPSVYIVEYSIIMPEKAISLNDGSVIENLTFSEHPTVYIPIFGNVADSERVIGHVKIFYNYTEEKYVARSALLNASDDNFVSGKRLHFIEQIGNIEKIQEICSEYGIRSVTNAILIRNSYAINDFSEKALIINSDGTYYAYDFTNSLHTENNNENMYLLSEYVEVRSAYEEKSKQTVNMEDISYGGVINTPDENTFYAKGVIIIGISLLVLCVLICITIYKIKLNKSK